MIGFLMIGFSTFIKNHGLVILPFVFHLIWWMIPSKVDQNFVRMLETVSFDVLIVAFMNIPISSSLDDPSLVLSSSSFIFSLEVEAFKEILLFYFLYVSFLFALDFLAFDLFNSCSCSVNFPNIIVIFKVFKSCDSFMDVTFGCHYLHIDLKTLLAQYWL